MKTDYYVHFKIVILLILSFFVLISNTQAATYYFSSSEGNDSRTAAQAQNESTPWKSIEKLNKVFLSISPGDRILFKRGDSFYGTIHITRSGTISAPITFGAYGDGDKPIITSLEEVNEWISVGNGIYESKDKFSNIEKINVLTIDNTLFSLGRFPNFDEENKGYLNITSTPNNNTILSTDLNGSLDWSGGEIVIRKNPWIIDRHFINSSSGSIINFQQTNSHYTASKNYGFFVQNHINTLDRFGEWCYDKKTEKIMIYFGHEIPSNHKIHISKLPYLMHFDWEEGNIIVTELDFRGANNSGIKIQGGINVKILKSNISFMAENAVEGILSHNLEISDCDINYSLNNGIYIENSTKNIVIKSNKISNTFTFNGMGKSSDLNGQAIYTTNDSHNGLIEKNRIYNTGYNAINFGGNNTIVKNNFIDNFCMHKSDGGGIYTWEGPGNLNKTGRSIENNIIINGIGYKEGTPYFNTINPTPIEGIYLDDNSSGIEIKNNSTANISNSGVYFHNARNIVFQKNLMFNCYQSVLLSHDEHGQEVRNVNIKNNIFLNPIPNNNFVKIFSIKEDFELMGEFDKNHYVNPLGNDFGFLQEFMFTNLNIQSKLMNLFWWNRDKNGKISPVNYNFSLNHEKLNENLFQNESFKNHVQKTYCNNNCNRNWSQSGYFKDGHVLINSSLNSQFTLETGKLAENSYYILRFSAKSNKDGFISIEINENGTPWRKLSKEQGFKISKDTQEFEFIFQSKIEAKSTLVTFKSNLEDFTYALDDVEFYEAEVNFRRHEDYVFFQYNDSNSSQKYPINGAYVDAYNNPFSGSVEIPPFSSVALIKVGDEKIQESIPPSISLITPKIDQEINLGDSLEIEVEASIGSAEIEKIEILVNNSSIKTFLKEPSIFKHFFEAIGTYMLQARIIDINGEESYSELISIKVNKELSAPQINWISPSDGDFFFAETPIQLAVSLIDDDISIEKVDFLVNNSIVGSTQNTPFQIAIPNLPVGKHNLQAIALSSDGIEGKSEVISINVTLPENTTPTITITAPSDNDQFFVGDPINIAANAVDADGSITKVEFFAGNNLLTTDTQAPFAFVWNDAPLGNHVISARTTDDNASTASSTEINILVTERPNNSPEITITAPSDNDQFFVGDPINIAANAVDADGSITKV
ncbi:Ig-like domain-containing protein, partial [Belliella sp. DSM 107340]